MSYARGTIEWYAANCCNVLARGGPRLTAQKNGWGDYLARYLYLREHGLARDP